MSAVKTGINYVQYTYSLWDDAGYWLLFAVILFQGFTIFVMGRTLDRTIRMVRDNARFVDLLSELDRARGHEMHVLRQIIGLRGYPDNGHAANGKGATTPTIRDMR
jgi:hypothetical protein